MNGCVLHHPPIAVDYWKVRDCTNVQLYFLSHMHGDHVVGLTPSWSQLIYCSPVTRSLLLDRFKLNPDKVCGLELNETHCLHFNENEDETLSVTLIDANHCPGAVMFCFEGYFGRILYTGDFRYSESFKYNESLTSFCESVVDELYLDNTFCSPKCCFPSREDSMAEMLSIISGHPEHRVIIGLRKLGKENLIVALALQLRVKVYVTEERYHLLELLGLPNVFTREESDARIHIVQQEEINARRMESWNEEMPTIAIIPTALYCILNLNRDLSNREDVFVVSYSDHSSYSDLHDFVSLVTPRAVLPILKDAKDRIGRVIPERTDMSCFDEHLDKTPRSAFSPPTFLSTTSKINSLSDRKVQKAYKRQQRFKKLLMKKGIEYENTSEEEHAETLPENRQCQLESVSETSNTENSFVGICSDSAPKDKNRTATKGEQLNWTNTSCDKKLKSEVDFEECVDEMKLGTQNNLRRIGRLKSSEVSSKNGVLRELNLSCKEVEMCLPLDFRRELGQRKEHAEKRMEPSRLILDSLEPLFVEEAVSMFRASHKNRMN